jgi:beta-glucosidase
LHGFKRIHIDPGQSQTVAFTLADRDLSIVDEAGHRTVAPGTVKVWIGGGQPAPKTAGARTQFTISSAATLPD